MVCAIFAFYHHKHPNKFLEITSLYSFIKSYLKPLDFHQSFPAQLLTKCWGEGYTSVESPHQGG